MQSSMSAECGNVYGPCVEDLVRIVYRLPQHSAMVLPKPGGGGGGRGGGRGGSNKHYAGGSAMVAGNNFSVTSKRIW